MELKTIGGVVIFALETAKTTLELVNAAVAAKKSLRGADLEGADLRGANLRGAYLRGANLRGAYLQGACLRGAEEKSEVAAMRVFSGLYDYEAWSVLFKDGSRWVRMGCLWYSLEKWADIGIRNSNPSEFPDNGSPRSEERVVAFEFAKAAAERLK